MNCAMPAAPFLLTARALNRLSCQITRAKNSTGSSFSAASCSSARQISSGVGGCGAAVWLGGALSFCAAGGALCGCALASPIQRATPQTNNSLATVMPDNAQAQKSYGLI